MLSFIPSEWIVLAIHGLVIFGIVGLIIGTVLKNLPFVAQYGIVIKCVATLLLLLGIYCEGGIGVETEWRLRMSALEEKIKIAEEKSAQVNTVIQTKVVEKIKIVKETTDANVKIVEKIVIKYDNLCTLSNAAISLHNSASQNTISASTGKSVEGTSDVKSSALISTIAENYGTYYQVREQVLGWQQWYSEQKKIFETIK